MSTRALIVLACLAVVASPTQVASATAVASQRDCSKEFGSFSAGHWPPACWRPYGATSPFNTPIPANPRIAPESTAIVDYMLSSRWSLSTDHRGNFTFDASGSRPVYWSQGSDPLVKVRCRGGFSCRPGMRLHIPKGAQPERGSDGHMTVVDQASGREYDFWRASRPEHGEMTASAANWIRIGAGVGTGLGGDGEAAYLGLLGGLIRAPELAAGRIEHALAMVVPCVQRRDVWPSPAIGGGDSVCAGYGAGPHFASLLQLNMSDAEIAATHARGWQRAIMKAMAHYGMYVVDTSGSDNTELGLIKEDDLSFISFGYPGALSSFLQSVSGTAAARGVPIDVSRLRVIAPCVPHRTC